MADYYALHWQEEADDNLARAPGEVGFDRLLGSGFRERWKVVTLTLNGTFLDYQPNNRGWRLCSERLRRAIDSHRTDRDPLQWLPAKIVRASEDARDYFILHFYAVPDVLNKAASRVDGDVVVVPVFDPAKVAAYHVLTFSQYGVDLLVSQEVRDAIVAAQCVGIDFSVVRQST